MRFTKMHGAGNDYVYVDARGQERDWPALSVAMSDRHLGVGSDGLILALPSEKADLRMRMFNADGSEGEMCGNGIRCLVSFAFDNGIVAAEKSPILVETMAGVLDVTPLRDDGQGMVGARVLMGEPRLNPPDVPVAIEGMDAVINEPLKVAGREFRMTCVSMGNPHAVVFMDEPVDEFPLTEIGPMVEHHPLFPARVNFEIANVLGRRQDDQDAGVGARVGDHDGVRHWRVRSAGGGVAERACWRQGDYRAAGRRPDGGVAGRRRGRAGGAGGDGV